MHWVFSSGQFQFGFLLNGAVAQEPSGYWLPVISSLANAW
jgi:hypothetical protein